MIHVFGHKNPDTDSIASAIAMAWFKRAQGHEAIAYRLGEAASESRFALNHFGIELPPLLREVRPDVRHLEYDRHASLSPQDSILTAYRNLGDASAKALAVTEPDGKLVGIVTMKDIAMGFFNWKGDLLKTTLANMVDGLEAQILHASSSSIEGKVLVAAFYKDTLIDRSSIDESTIVIVGDRYDVLEHAVRQKAALIIVTGGLTIPGKILRHARESDVCMIRTPYDTLKTARLIASCAPVSEIMIRENLTSFYEHDDVSEAREVMAGSRHTTFPVTDASGRYVGFLSRRHLLRPNKHLVILVDHNEYAQSVDGLKEAEILAIVDHHKLGDVVTNRPLTFVCRPVGSTCTLVGDLIREEGVVPPSNIAGILLSGIISDTLNFQSPTTTEEDRIMAAWLTSLIGNDFDMENYAKALLKSGTSLEGQTAEAVFFKDFKIFRDADTSVGVSQIFTYGLEEVEVRREAILEMVQKTHKEQGFDATVFMATDLLSQGSCLYYKSNITGLITKSFEVDEVQGVFVPGLLSRKKQVIPRLLEEIGLSRQMS